MEKNLNGIDVDQLVGTINAIKEKPALAKFNFRAETAWVRGGQARTTIQGFHGAGGEDDSRSTPFVLTGDEPPVLLGENAGPNAVEAVLHALGSCLVVGFAYNAAARGIGVEALTLKLTGDIDLHGFLGLSDEIRPGYSEVRVSWQAKSSASPEQLAELWAHVRKTSPVLDVLRKPVSVTFAEAE